MRLSTNLTQRTAVESMLRQQAELHDTQMQLSTGKRILTPSDDPTASSLIIQNQQTLAAFEQYNVNAEQAKSRLEAEETTVRSIVNVLQRARELAVTAANDSLTQSDRQGLTVEIQEAVKELRGLVNTRDPNGDYIFSGFKGQTPAFDAAFNYQGDQGQRFLQIGPDRQIADSDNGFELFVKTPAGNILRKLTDFANDIAAPGSVPPTYIDELGSALEHVLSFQAKTGARLKAIESQSSVNADFVVQMETTLSNLQDLDYAEAIGQLNIDMAGLTAAQKSYSKVQGLSLFNYI